MVKQTVIGKDADGLAPLASPTFTGTQIIPNLDTGVAAAGVTLSGTTLAADGTDTNIPINITPKGTGKVIIGGCSVNGVVPVEESVGFTLEGGTTSKTLTVDETSSVSGKLNKTANITALNETGIADGEICVFNATNKDIRTSDKTIVTTIGADDLTVPTSKAVVDKVTTGETNLTIAIRAGEYLRKGQALYISGTSSGIPLAYKCDCTVLGKSRAIGLAQSDMNPGDATIDGFARRGGTLTAVDCRTSGTVAGYVNPLHQTWANGDLLFALGDANAGGLTNVRPTSGRSVKVCYAVNGNDPSCTLLCHVMENPVFSTCAANEDVVLRCGDNAGTNKVSIRDYANNEVASIDSDGKTTTPAIKITGGTPGVGKVLTSDADGDGTWETAAGGATFWTALANFTATPASTSTITMGTDQTATILVGSPLKYTIGGTVYYGMVSAITSNLLTVAGAPLGGDVTALSLGDASRIEQVDIVVNGYYEDADNTALIGSDLNAAVVWRKSKSYAVAYKVWSKVHDSHATHGKATVLINATELNTSADGLTIAADATWYSTVVDIATAAYDINPAEAIEIAVKKGGTGDAHDLVVSIMFVHP